jgi:hypothetical protein
MHTDCEMCFGKSGKRRVGERCHCATTKRVSRTLAWVPSPQGSGSRVRVGSPRKKKEERRKKILKLLLAI